MGKGKKKLKDGKTKNKEQNPRQMTALKNELKSLEFQNPGPHFQAFYQTIPPRSRGKILGVPVNDQPTDQFLAVYNNEGQLSASKQDLCDCMSQECPGCHFPCMKCDSCKCGVECRCNRKWQYFNKKEVDGNSDSALTTTEIQRTILIPLDDTNDYLYEDPSY
ncbi:hypothetical protein LOD99_5765 [Oopsacas minuta]|uniref:ARF7 effector protein C-terminal domain-containing protein n=1 Tax=Oopsacas minuta TaxID=111878 RepID=A0AAV7JPU5_9METZ|nr:hypothetical protein LOD99_5765 [Oopsacas minuta]